MGACRSCGAENRAGARFCDACGARLDEGTGGASPVRKTVTVLFADVIGSTALGERLDPESVRALMARFFATARRIIERHGGTVEKYVGDAVMAVFGVPVVHEDDAIRAVRAASELEQAVEVLAVQLRRDQGIELAIRTGVNTGPVVAGDGVPGETLATGDAVNVAARLQQAAASGEVLIGGSTHRLVRDAVEVEALGVLSLRGRAEPVAAFRLIAVGPAADTPARRLDVPIVGRERELALLGRVFDDVVIDRRTHLFTLLGAPGVGKSRLVREFLASAAVAGTGATVLRGRCLPYGEGLTYWAIAEAIKGAAGIAEGDPHETARTRVRELTRDRPGGEILERRIAEVVGLEAEGSPADELTWAVRSLVESMADAGPVVLVLDDLQWAEPPLLDLIEHLAELSRDAPILLLCLARPDLLENRTGWSGGKLNATTLLLEALPRAEAELLAERLLGGALPEPVRRQIADAAEGNPLFVEEFVGMLADEGLLDRDGGAWTARADLTTIVVPPTIQALLAARLDRLPPPERAVAGRASIVGRVFEAGAVVALSPEAERSAIRERLGSLVRKELVRPDRPGIGGQDAYRFRHLLIRDAAYEGLSKLDRAALHERCADWLTDVTGDRLVEHEEIIGYHLEQAFRYREQLGPLDDGVLELARRAALHLGSAGRRAAAREDAGAAKELLRAALDLARVGSHEAAAGLGIELADTLSAAGEWEAARRVLGDLPPRVLDDPLMAARIRFIDLGTRVNTDPTTKFESIDRGLAELADTFEGLGDERDRIRALVTRGFLLFARGRAAEAVELFDHAVELGRRPGSSLWILPAQWIPIDDALGPCPAGEAVARAEALLETAVGHPGLTAMVLLGLGTSRVAHGDAERGLAELADGAERLGTLGQALWRGGGLQLAGYARMSIGDLEGAERALRSADTLLAEIGETGFRSTVDALLAKALIELDRSDEAEPWIELGRSMAAEDDILTQLLWRSAAARLAALAGDVERALALGREAVAIARTSDYITTTGDALLDLAEVERASGDPPAARASARAALDLFRQKEDRFAERRAERVLATLDAEA